MSSTSRYNYAPVIAAKDANGILTEPIQYGMRPFLANIGYPDSSVLQVGNGDTLQRLAYRAYGTCDQFWVIGDFSNIVDPFSDLISDDQYYYVGSLTVGISAGVLTSFTTDHPDNFQRSDQVIIESLDPAAYASVTAVVKAVQQNTGLVVVSPVDSPAIPTMYSRIMKKYQQPINVVLPSLNRVQFDVLDFGNSLNTLNVE